MAIKIMSRAPARIDLAGGTVDIWPLFLFLKNPVTLNLAIDVYAETDVDVTPADQGKGGELRFRSEDQNAELKIAWDGLDAAAQSPPPALILQIRLLKYFA